MKKNTKILIICLAALLLIALVVSIVVINNNNKYSDKLTSNELYNAVANSFETSGGTKVLDSDVILEFTDNELSYLKDYIVVKANIAKNINEVGIFRVEEGKSGEMKILVEKYVATLQQSYRAMDYFPEEVEKIDFATVKVFGNYIVYSFLNENDTEAFYNAIENQIKE